MYTYGHGKDRTRYMPTGTVKIEPGTCPCTVGTTGQRKAIAVAKIRGVLWA